MAKKQQQTGSGSYVHGATAISISPDDFERLTEEHQKEFSKSDLDPVHKLKDSYEQAVESGSDPDLFEHLEGA
jgi:hypothetical protein